MALITIKDLPQDTELDRTAMLAISGGARARGRPAPPDGASPRQLKVVDYPPGFVRDGPGPASRLRSTT